MDFEFWPSCFCNYVIVTTYVHSFFSLSSQLIWNFESISKTLFKMCSSIRSYSIIDPNLPECQVKIGQTMPNFEGKSLEGPISLHKWLEESWGIVFTVSGAFGPICATEIGAIASKSEVQWLNYETDQTGVFWDFL